MEFAILFSILALIFLFSLHLIKLQRKSSKKHSHPPPGPKGLPIIGNLHQFDNAKPHEFLWKLSKIYGPVMQLQLGCRTALVISSSKTAKEALKTQDIVFSGRPSLVVNNKISYNGLSLAFSTYNEYWRDMRKTCVLHLFSIKKVQSFRPIREDEISLSMNEISNLVSNNSQKVINLSTMMLDLTSSFICRVAFGGKSTKQKKRFHEMLEECQALLSGVFVSDFFPWLSLIDRISGMNARLEKNFKDFGSFYQELIDEHLDPNRPETMKEDILDVLIQLKEHKLTANFDLTWDHIKAILMDIFVAGTDTGAAAIVWAMTALVKKPDAMKRVQAEIREAVGKKGMVDEDDLQGLTYLKAVVKETMRLYPPAPLLVPRETTGNCNIEGYDIKGNTIVFVNAWAIARDPENWENPNEFIPERFLNNCIDMKGNDFEVIPFGAGRRGCPGLAMGLAIVELALANLLYIFDWGLPLGVKVDDIDTETTPGITMHKKNPLCLVANKHY